MTGNEAFAELARRVFATELWVLALMVAVDGWNSTRMLIVESLLIAHPKCRPVRN